MNLNLSATNIYINYSQIQSKYELTFTYGT